MATLEEVERRRQELYLEIRREPLNRKYESQAQFDKYILTLSSASLGFSVAFLKDIPFLNKYNNWIIITSWMLFIISSIITLASFKTSAIAFDKQIKYIDGQYEGKNPEKPTTFDKVTKVLNFLNSLFFGAGLIFTFIYIWSNLQN